VAGYQANHHCDNPACIETASGHLYEGTQRENIADRTARQRHWAQTDSRGSTVQKLRGPMTADHRANVTNVARSRARLDVEDIETIRRRYQAGGVTQKQIGAEYGIGQSHVSQIVHQKIWGDRL
jgi:DNA-directed RNA polymerase specialized sigma subunit